MKYFFRVLLVLIIAVAVVFGVYYYTQDGEVPFLEKDKFQTTVTKQPATEKYASRTLLASLDKYDFRLYKSESAVILEHKDKEFTFENWSSVIDEETPKMYYADFDGDKDKELIIRAVAGQDDETKEFVYELYVLNPKAGKNEDYDVLLVSQDSWRGILDEQVTEELSQLKSCKKVLQFAMDAKEKGISYNQDTGVAEGAAYTGYAKAMQEGGQYLTLSGWTKSKGNFEIDEDNHISVEVDCIANYDESHIVQTLGKIYFKFSVTTENKLAVLPKSMYFKPDDKYKVSNPTDVAKANWSTVRNNSFTPTEAKTISWTKYSMKIDPTVMTDTVDLAGQDTDIKYVKSIQITQSDVVLTAPDNCTFSEDGVKKGDFSVIINKGKKDEMEISYTAKISKDKKIVRLTFDKTYDQSKIKTVEINYGSK